MSEPSRGEKKGPTASKTSSALEEAMMEAVKAVEAQERESVFEIAGAEDESEEEEVELSPADPPEEPSKAAEEEPGDEEDQVSALLAAKRELEQVLEQTQAEATTLKERWLRAAADLENYRKRAGRERDEIVKFGNEKLLKDFLPVLDDLDRTIEVLSAGAGSEGSMSNVLDGLALVQRKFLAQLAKHGVTTFETIGAAFDPANQEAVQQVHATVPAGAVALELRRGYLLNDRLLRPAMVAVSLGPDPTNTTTDNAAQPGHDPEPAAPASAEAEQVPQTEAPEQASPGEE